MGSADIRIHVRTFMAVFTISLGLQYGFDCSLQMIKTVLGVTVIFDRQARTRIEVSKL